MLTRKQIQRQLVKQVSPHYENMWFICSEYGGVVFCTRFLRNAKRWLRATSGRGFFNQYNSKTVFINTSGNPKQIWFEAISGKKVIEWVYKRRWCFPTEVTILEIDS